jgi:hypothetical protein
VCSKRTRHGPRDRSLGSSRILEEGGCLGLKCLLLSYFRVATRQEPWVVLDRDLLHEPMVWACAVRHLYALAYDLRAVYAPLVAAMIIWNVGHFERRVAFVGAIGNQPFVVTIVDTVLAADIDAMIVRSKNHVVGSNLTLANLHLSPRTKGPSWIGISQDVASSRRRERV